MNDHTPPTAASLQIFSATADERARMGDSLFLSTHVKIHMRSSRRPHVWSEDDLLTVLLAPYSRGNRVFALYGAAGSGKSELIRWLSMHIRAREPERSRYVVRISRTDLGVPALVAKLAPLLPAGASEEEVWERWEELRSAPTALTNAVVWTALNRLLPDDNRALPAGYALRPLVERALKSLLDRGVPEGPFDVLWDEDFRAAQSEYPALEGQDTQRLRDALVESLDAFTAPTVRLPQLLSKASRAARASGKRPLLLFDDLVQAVPTHAAAILDWATTLDEGDWDVVIGLTPGSLQSDKRARALVERITRLDTFDDRMCKLWLTDEAGEVSYSLAEDMAETLLRRYLRVLRGNRECAQDDELWPFTPDLARRLYRAVPSGKGHTRALLLTVREILLGMADGRMPDEVLSEYIPPEAAARHSDPKIRRACEVYGEFRDGRLLLGATIARKLGIADRAIAVRAEPLIMSEAPVVSVAPARHSNVGTAAVRIWLEGGSPNPQALRPLRLGVARLARLTANGLGMVGSSRKSALRLERTGNGTSPPVQLEGVDATEGIPIGRWIGDLAYDISRLANSDNRTTKQLIMRILSDARSAEVIWTVHAWETDLRREIDEALGREFDVLVARMRRVAALTGGPSSPPLPVLDSELPPIEWRGFSPLSPGTRLRRSLDGLIADLYCARENVWDGRAIRMAISGLEPAAMVDDVLSGDHRSLHVGFRVGEVPLRQVLIDMQDAIRVAVAMRDQEECLLGPAEAVSQLETGCPVPLAALSEEALRHLRFGETSLLSTIELIARQETASSTG